MIYITQLVWYPIVANISTTLIIHYMYICVCVYNFLELIIVNCISFVT